MKSRYYGNSYKIILFGLCHRRHIYKHIGQLESYMFAGFVYIGHCCTLALTSVLTLSLIFPKDLFVTYFKILYKQGKEKMKAKWQKERSRSLLCLQILLKMISFSR